MTLTEDAKKLRGDKSVTVPDFDGITDEEEKEEKPSLEKQKEDLEKKLENFSTADDDSQADVLADLGDLTYDQLYKLAKEKFEFLAITVDDKFPDRKPGRVLKQELIELLND